MNKILAGIGIGLAWLLLPSIALADITTVTLEPVLQAQLDSGSPTTSVCYPGGLDTTQVSHNTPSSIRNIITFDLTDIPANATIRYAYLKLYDRITDGEESDPPTDIEIHAIPTTRIVTCDATWLKYNASQSWTTAGGDYTTQNFTLSVPAYPYDVGCCDINKFDVWSVTQFVRNADRSGQFILKFKTESGTLTYQWDAAQYEDVQVPQLIVSYEIASQSMGEYWTNLNFFEQLLIVSVAFIALAVVLVIRGAHPMIITILAVMVYLVTLAAIPAMRWTAPVIIILFGIIYALLSRRGGQE